MFWMSHMASDLKEVINLESERPKHWQDKWRKIKEAISYVERYKEM